MGLAPYGNPNSETFEKWKKIILDEMIDLRDDGSFLLNMDLFNYAAGLTMCPEDKWEKLFGVPKREPESELSQPYMDLALAVQQITEKIVLRIAETAKQLTGSKHIVLAGSVALNCVANGKLLMKGLFEDIWIQPASGDAGGALGAAYAAWHIWRDQDRTVVSGRDSMKGAYLGSEFCSRDIQKVAKKFDAPFKEYDDFDRLCMDTAELIEEGNVVGWFQGRMEYGPRALGNRSIIGDPRNPEMQRKLNLKIKYREGFRPFAPSVMEEKIAVYFEMDHPTPYMLLVAPVRENRRNPLPDGYEREGLYERLYFSRSDIPAITHVDYSARIQSVNKKTNEKYWKLINAFKARTGFGVIVNTSFNVRGEPIVCTPAEAYTSIFKFFDQILFGRVCGRVSRKGSSLVPTITFNAIHADRMPN